MRAAVIDVGSNTVRMVIGDCHHGTLIPRRYEREVVRLAGEFSPRSGLADASMSRAFTTLKSFQTILSQENLTRLRIIGTAALRRAANRQFFIDKLYRETSLQLEVISGEEEAQLTAQGVLSVIEPDVKNAIIVDIGGGSTEFVCLVAGKVCFQKSYPVGVVRLCEEYPTENARSVAIAEAVDDFFEQLKYLDLDHHQYQLIGTAGTVTTLAAIDLGLQEYCAEKINNHVLSEGCVKSLKVKLEGISFSDREQLAGMEKGRGDLIVYGLNILLYLIQVGKFSAMIVADAGLLEGAFLKLCSSKAD